MTEPTSDCKLRVSSKSLGIRPSASSSLLIVFNFLSTADIKLIHSLQFDLISFRFSASKSCQSLSCPPFEKLLRVHHIGQGVHKKYPCLKLTEKLDRNYVDVSMRSDKHASMMSGKEDGQGITVDKASFTSKIMRF